MSTLIIICGLPGTGKTFVAKKIALKINGILLRTDVIRKEIRSSEYSEEEKQRVYGEVLSRAEKLLKEKRNVVLDATFAKRKNRQTAKKLAKNLKADFKIIEVVCPEKIVKERMKKRKKGKNEVKLAKFKHYLEHKEFFEPPKEKHVVIDTSKNIEKELSKLS